MANRKYIPKFKQGGYFGAEAMEGDKGLDIRNLFAGMKQKKEAFQKGQAKRSKGRGIIDILEKVANVFDPTDTLSSLIDVGGQQYLQSKYDVEGGPDLSELETMWTGGEGTAGQEEWEKIYGASDETLGEGVLRSAGEFDFSSLFGGGGFDLSSLFGGGGGSPNIWDARTGDYFRPSQLPQEFSGTYTLGNTTYTGDTLWREGGRVPQYYGGGSVSGTPTIVDYFSNQGKTLGGSDKLSLAEKLGMK